MAGTAVRTEPATVGVVISMAGIAVGGCAPEDVVDMTTCTGDSDMFAGQFEGEQVVVDGGRQPTRRRMAGAAIRTKLSIVLVILGMAGVTTGRCAFEDVVDVASLAGDRDMFTFQFEGEQVVVDGGRQPTRRCMAVAAIRTELTFVLVIFGMAGIAVGGSALENMVDMTVLAGHVRVFAFQFEGRQVVVEGGRDPAGGGMAGAAIGAITALVVIVFGVAGVAVLRCSFEVRNGAGIQVATAADGLGVLADQLEGLVVVVEIVTIGVNPIVASQAVGPESQHVDLRKDRVHLLVAGCADGLVEWRGIGLPVTIRAAERGAIGFALVGFERVPQRFVREVDIGHVCQWGIRPAVVWVAVAAGQAGIVLAQDAVQCGWVLPLGSHVGVADHTPVGHAGGTPEGGVTQAALSADFCMGTHAAQRCTDLGIECAGAEQHAARCEREPCDDEGGQNGSHDAGGGETTQVGILHHSPTAAGWHNTRPRRCG